MNLGQRIKELREEKGITQSDFAATLNIARSTLSQYESNQRTPNDEIKLKIAEFFNVSLDYLLCKTNIKDSADDIIKDMKPIDKINKAVKVSGLGTIAAHFDGEEFTDDDLEDIQNFINYVLSKKKK